MDLQGGAVGRWFGAGRVYVMHYYDIYGTHHYKIGCTSRNPNVRLAEIQRNEGNYYITLVGSIQANEMNSAETAAQEAVKEIGMVKDPSRGGATDWFVSWWFTPEQVFGVVMEAVQEHNAVLQNYSLRQRLYWNAW